MPKKKLKLPKRSGNRPPLPERLVTLLASKSEDKIERACRAIATLDPACVTEGLREELGRALPDSSPTIAKFRSMSTVFAGAELPYSAKLLMCATIHFKGIAYEVRVAALITARDLDLLSDAEVVAATCLSGLPRETALHFLRKSLCPESVHLRRYFDQQLPYLHEMDIESIGDLMEVGANNKFRLDDQRQAVWLYKSIAGIREISAPFLDFMGEQGSCSIDLRSEIEERVKRTKDWGGVWLLSKLGCADDAAQELVSFALLSPDGVFEGVRAVREICRHGSRLSETLSEALRRRAVESPCAAEGLIETWRSGVSPIDFGYLVKMVTSAKSVVCRRLAAEYLRDGFDGSDLRKKAFLANGLDEAIFSETDYRTLKALSEMRG